MNRKLFAAVLVLALGAMSFSQARATYEARLVGSTVAKGKAKYQTRLPQAELQVEGENLVAGAVYRIKVGRQTWTAVADMFRTIRLERRWLTGAPNYGAGTTVSIANASNVIILSGAFVRVR